MIPLSDNNFLKNFNFELYLREIETRALGQITPFEVRYEISNEPHLVISDLTDRNRKPDDEDIKKSISSIEQTIQDVIEDTRIAKTEKGEELLKSLRNLAADIQKQAAHIIHPSIIAELDNKIRSFNPHLRFFSSTSTCSISELTEKEKIEERFKAACRSCTKEDRRIATQLILTSSIDAQKVSTAIEEIRSVTLALTKKIDQHLDGTKYRWLIRNEIVDRLNFLKSIHLALNDHYKLYAQDFPAHDDPISAAFENLVIAVQKYDIGLAEKVDRYDQNSLLESLKAAISECLKITPPILFRNATRSAIKAEQNKLLEESGASENWRNLADLIIGNSAILFFNPRDTIELFNIENILEQEINISWIPKQSNNFRFFSELGGSFQLPIFFSTLFKILSLNTINYIKKHFNLSVLKQKATNKGFFFDLDDPSLQFQLEYWFQKERLFRAKKLDIKKINDENLNLADPVNIFSGAMQGINDNSIETNAVKKIYHLAKDIEAIETLFEFFKEDPKDIIFCKIFNLDDFNFNRSLGIAIEAKSAVWLSTQYVLGVDKILKTVAKVAQFLMFTGKMTEENFTELTNLAGSETYSVSTNSEERVIKKAKISSESPLKTFFAELREYKKISDEIRKKTGTIEEIHARVKEIYVEPMSNQQSLFPRDVEQVIFEYIPKIPVSEIYLACLNKLKEKDRSSSNSSSSSSTKSSSTTSSN